MNAKLEYDKENNEYYKFTLHELYNDITKTKITNISWKFEFTEMM